jgi:hypothetical protein
MGGTGEKVRFEKFRAEKGNNAAREELKKKVEATIAESTETITIIALIEEPGGRPRQPGGGSS